jgi:hypothetical protein
VARLRRVEPDPQARDWRKNPARASEKYDLRLRGEALKRVQAHVEQTYEQLDEEGKRLADERMVRKFRGQE